MIYIHVPFCRSFCTYCGFYSEVAGPGRDEKVFGTYTDFLKKEIAERKAEIEATSGTNTLYIGGGTPSVLPLSLLGDIVGALPGGDWDEFTVEVNPEDIVEKGVDYAHGLRSLGVNRVSMGVQSFDDCTLRWMNRRHDSRRAREAFRILREAGIGNISIDLIFGIGGVGDQQWRETVLQALHIGDECGGRPQHISAYQLSIEDGSALDRMIRDGRYSEASEELCRSQYEILCKELSEAGYSHYEVSNFALPGFEARHNSAYWTRIPYVGLGAGAHSFDGTVRRWNSEMNDHGHWTCESETLSLEDAVVEKKMLSLRTARGIDEQWLMDNSDPATVRRLLSEGALVMADGGVAGTMIRIPESSFFVSDEIIRELI